jgi:hypothetical protein
MDRLELTPLRGLEMVVECVAAVGMVFIILLTIGSLAYAQRAETTILATWKPEYAQNSPAVNKWFHDQQMNDETWERLGSPSWHSCCEKGDVFKTQFRVGKGQHGDDEWWYLKDGTWKQVPDDTIHWGQHAPGGQPTLFIYSNTGQELCFYPPEEGI